MAQKTNGMKSQMKSQMVGHHISLDLISDIGDRNTWALIYKYFLEIMNLKIAGQEGTVLDHEYIEQQWALFKSSGVITYRKSDESKVQALIGDLKGIIRSTYGVF